MTKSLLLSAFLTLFVTISTQEAGLTSITVLPTIEVLAPSIESEIYSTLVTRHDSVAVLNGTQRLFVNIEPLDSSLARIVLAQAYLESGSFESELTTVHYNVFGMTYPRRGKMTTSVGPLARAEGRNGYASYLSYKSSTLDLMLLLEYYKLPKIKSATHYVHYIKSKHYFEADERQYLQTLKKHLIHVDNLFQKSV